MFTNHTVDATPYKIVMSEEAQYSIWPAYKQEPAGWVEVGKPGSKEECLAQIEALWTDMREKRLREKMARQ